MKDKGGCDIGGREYLDRSAARLKGNAHRARVQRGGYRQQGAFTLIRAFPIFLNLPLIERHHLAQTFLKERLRFPRFSRLRI